MSDIFDPYQAWLGIPPQEQPPNHYRLLGLRAFEGSAAEIAAAADRRTGNLHAFQKGEHAKAALKLLNEVAVAKTCLLNPNRKVAYDKGLRQRLETEAAETMKSNEAQRALCEQFLASLEDKDLLSAALIENLRQQVGQSKKPIPAAGIAKRLVEAGHLTPALAKRLLTAAEKSVRSAMPAEPKPTPAVAKTRPEEEDLGLAPLEEETGRKTPPDAAEKDDLGLAPLEEQQPAETAKPPPAKTAPPQAAKTTRPQAEKPTKPQSQKPAKAPAEKTAKGQAAGASGSLLDEELSELATGPGDLAAMGPLDGLMAGQGLDEAAAGGPLAPIAPKKKGLWRFFSRAKRKRAKKEKENVWDTSLMLVGGGTLLVLLILGSVLLWAVMRGGGDEMLDAANDEYRAGSYTQAISKYKQYLKKFPNHNGASIARVRTGLAQLRQATAKGTTDWPGALETARSVIGEIAPEKDFPEAHGDLSVMLLAIVEGLSAQARAKTDPALVERANETLALIEKYVPKSLRQGVKLGEVKASLAITMRNITRGKELDKAIAAIGKAVSQGNAAGAYQVRKALLKQYPLLADDPKLAGAVRAISRAQQATVKFVEKLQQPDHSEPVAAVLCAVAPARTINTADVPGAEGHVVYALADGGVYALDAAAGRLLWRRFVGFDGTGRGLGFPPTPVDQAPGSDLLLVNPAGNELWRVEAKSGRIRWRHPLGERFDAHPVITPGKLLVATRSGRLVAIDPDSGSSTGYVQIPQSLRVAGAADSGGGLFFQPADHSNLFVLSPDDGNCRQVVYLGHEPGSITAPPVVSGQYLIIVVNDRTEDSTLHVLSISRSRRDDAEVCKPIQQLRLKGHVDFPPVVSGRRVLVATDLGTIIVFELGGADPKTPLREVAASEVGGAPRVVRFPLMQGGHFWLADDKLTKYDILAANKQMIPKWITAKRSTFVQPLVAVAGAVFHVRRTAGMPGVTVTAVAMDEPEPYWETQLAVPLAAEPIVDAAGGAVTAVTAAASLFRLADVPAGKTVLNGPAVALDPAQVPQPITDVVPLAGGLLALSAGNGSRQIAVYDPEIKGRYRQVPLPDPLACRPIAFAGGLLAPSTVGGVFLMDAVTGKELAEPFMPPLEGQQQLAWCPPVARGENEVLLSDGRSALYRLGVAAEPKPHLKALGQVALSEPVVSPMAVIGNIAYAVDGAGVLTAFELPAFGRGKQRSLAGRAVWGPGRIGEHVLLATDDGQLLCLDEQQKLAWQVSLPFGPLAGAPLALGKDIILAAAAGTVWRVEADTGKQLGRIDTQRPLGTGPVLRGTQLLIGGHDGTLYELQQP